ncbi:MAG: phosphomannomutase/phosphoglucomutase [Gammaproteobacteria bacterium]|nr:MAG: phosphomannomutase/phosphoglucomutase [Gammaproteobacteria bacterium]
MPVLLVALAGILIPTSLAWQSLQDYQARLDEQSAKAAAEALAARIAAHLQGRKALLKVVTSSAAVHEALKGGKRNQLDRAARVMEQLLPEVLQIRLFSPREAVTLEPDPQGKAPMGFAGVDLVRRALRGEVTAAEVHQIASGRPYLGMASPIREKNAVIGAVFAAWPVGKLQQVVVAARQETARLWLVQGGRKGYALGGAGKPPPDAEGIAVPGSIWKVYYLPVPAQAAGVWVLLSAAGALLLLVIAVAFLQHRTLRRDLTADMARLSFLAEALLDPGRAPETGGAVTEVARDAMTKLSELVREQRRGGGVTPQKVALKTKRSKEPKAAVEEAASLGIEVTETEERPAVPAPANCFRAYDIRGLAETEVSDRMALGLGWAFGELARDNGVEEVFIAHDPRPSSPLLYDALCNGLAEMGLRVVELGMVPVGVLYVAMHRAPESAAVMVTGSHNPPEYNGFKLYLRTAPVHGEQLQQLRERMQQGGFEPRPGFRERRDVLNDYLDAIAGDISLGHPVTVVVDGGNGAAGEVACRLLERLGCEVVPLFCEPDGSFPHHHPDPSRPENLEALRAEVVGRGAALGIAFDGDGDRIGVVDDQGEPVRPEHLLMLLAGDILRRHPGSDVIFDVKSSRHLATFILAQGGRPIMWRAGHTLMKEKMRETGALIGGEYSGHIYIKERWFGSDDGIYVAARLLEVVTEDPRSLHEQLAELPVSPATPELQLMMAEGQPQQAMRAIMAIANFPDARVVDLDGLRIEFGEGWGLVRPSNTTPSLVFRFEADDEAALEEIRARFRELLHKALPDVTPPF